MNVSEDQELTVSCVIRIGIFGLFLNDILLTVVIMKLLWLKIPIVVVEFGRMVSDKADEVSEVKESFLLSSFSFKEKFQLSRLQGKLTILRVLTSVVLPVVSSSDLLDRFGNENALRINARCLTWFRVIAKSLSPIANGIGLHFIFAIFTKGYS